MREFFVEADLKKKLSRLFKKDIVLYNATLKKIEEIVCCNEITHYKNLRGPLKEFKRVHVKSSFVLIFKYIESEDKVVFYDLDHHDNIYQIR